MYLKNEDDSERVNQKFRHYINELEQQKKILTKINKSLEDKSKKTEIEKDVLNEKFENLKHQSKEIETTKKILAKTVLKEEQRNQNLSKKQILTIMGASIVISGIFIGNFMFSSETLGQRLDTSNINEIKSNYVIQNLRGDTIDTWLSWRLVDNEVLYINVVNYEKHADKMEIIKDTILSAEIIEVDNSLLHKGPKGTKSSYYLGWAGALKEAASKPTKLNIPVNFKFIESNRGEGDITIRLTEARSGDGYSGFTKSIADESQNQILKSEITIYDINNISNSQLETILRHEFGHALGLAHSTAPEDLMHPKIETDFPYISECNVDAIISLYDEKKDSKVICES